ncbi:hypothetical protein [Geitlerinema sp. PCC 7407]|uniref:hypothetical protein n=1 Tax=Geitlerinema sp. PCC 7407 TaxID=1173025 RepID=UPI00029FD9D2|nr:hypothetical protein [Geitlerinema sp. PCC 7407]AFY65550.1 hypothetical protein GEI7407_1053 [Geitlerinema sp. PCC 7407]
MQLAFSRRWAPLGAIAAGLLAASLPMGPAAAASEGDYRRCASNLVEAGIRPEEAAEACSTVLHPEDLSRCVDRLDERTEIAATDALAACRRVRRPVELATCVTDIRQKTENAAEPQVLDNCRRSLLPERYANCVVGLTEGTDLAVNVALQSCIDGRDRVNDFYPTFIPVGQSADPFVPFTAPTSNPTP